MKKTAFTILCATTLPACGPAPGNSQTSDGSTEPSTSSSVVPTEGTAGATGENGAPGYCTRRDPGPSSAPGFHWSLACSTSAALLDPLAVVTSDQGLVVAFEVHDTALPPALDLGGGALMSHGDSDVVVARFDADGQHVWSQIWGTTAAEELFGLVAMPHGGVAVVISAGGELVVGGQSVEVAGEDGSLLAALDANGQFLWSRTFVPQTPDSVARFSELASAPNGMVAAVGIFNGTAILDADRPFSSTQGDSDFLVAVFAANGDLLRAEVLPFANGASIAEDGSVVLGLGHAIGRFDPAGLPMWVHPYAGDGDIRHIVNAPNGDTIVAGFFQTTVDLGGGEITNVYGDDDTANFNPFVARLDGDGNHLWSLERHDPKFAQTLPMALGLNADDQTFLIYGHDTPTHIDVFASNGALVLTESLHASRVGGGAQVADGSLFIVGAGDTYDMGGGSVAIEGLNALWFGRVTPGSGG